MNYAGRAVEVLRRRGRASGSRCGTWTVGSGYLVGGRYVLTAAHNVTTGSAVDEVVLVRCLDRREYPAGVLAAGPPEGPDLAVLAVVDGQFPEAVPTVAFARVDREGAVPLTDCWAIGYPGFNAHPAESPDLPPLRDSVQVDGVVPPGSHLRRGLLQLLTAAAPSALSGTASQWQGMSGAVVFARDPARGPLAVGVVSEHHRPEGDSSLTVVPVTALGALDGGPGSGWWRRLGLGAWVTLPPPAARVPTGPLELGRPSAHFTDREREAADVTAMLTRDLADTVPVVVLYGMGGVGKTALARQVGHRLGTVFPYARVLVELGGGPVPEVSTDGAVVQLLGRLGVRPDAMPREPEERLRELRRRLRQGPCLVVIDNASGPRQVEALLPDAPGSAAIVTSRSALTAIEGADRVPLDPLPDEEGVRLFERIVGIRTLPGDREAGRTIVTLVGGLPLAIRVTAAAAASPAMRRRPLAVLAERLADDRQRLLGMRSGDIGLRSSFDLSYRLLREETRGLFRCLGLLPGIDFVPEVAALAAGLPVGEVERLLTELAERQLVEVGGEAVARYQLHDTVRIYARERAEREDPAPGRRDAFRRALQWYETSLAALMSRPGAQERPPADALAWYADEHLNVQAGLRSARDLGEWDLVAGIAGPLYGLLSYRGRWEDLEATKAWAVEAARELDDESAELGSLIHLAEARRLTGRTEGIPGLYERALEITRSLGDDGRRGWVLTHYGDLECRLGRPEEGLRRYAEAAAIYDAQDDDEARIWLSAHVSDAQLQSGRPEEAARTQEAALRLSRERDDPAEVAWCAWHLALCYDAAGRYEDAEGALAEAIAFHRAEHDRGGLATVLTALARVHTHAGRPDPARTALREALELVRSIDAPGRVAEIQAELTALEES
ncbi:tetratricopeptide repeat protein [Streptomyces sp. NPDC004609]|uniref:tetratricopeptide repeat protein n=1 Tax=Streptomyces sp. NPDC004609 TaxID=3364704 RepID=UPI00367DB81A